MVKRRLGLAAVAVISALLLSSCWTTYATPYVLRSDVNFADPGGLVAEGRYWMFATNWAFWRIPVLSSSSPTSGWTGTPTEALPSPPAKALGHFWGPEVQYMDGWYYMYYGATVAWDGSPYGEHAIFVARSSRAAGPYTPVGPQPLYRDPWRRGVIDPDVVQAADGSRYLLWSVDWGPGGRGSSVTRAIQGCRLNNPTSVSGTCGTLITANRSNWERGTVEAPALLQGPDGYSLVYSGGNFEGPYATGVASCGSNPLGPCTKWNTANPYIGTGWNGTVNPGGADFVPYYWGVYAAFFHANRGSVRAPHVQFVVWRD
ncbi:MAG: family 43 glycosylhydrolase [Acidimicrobiia bacterium]|nr:family 43 glycosylhydrolase [Acidimicrobiia bacterium]